ncbi:MAG: tetratricopeptide repeat protein [bacterium]|nr:tetratricopeptide repeat protein [bacterium]
MKIILIPLLIAAVLGACSSNKGVVKTELEFGNKLAKEGLWKEAHYRWTKVLENGKETGSIYNNIAIALENMGKFDEAEAAYKKALSLEPNNPTIQGNYDKFQKYLRNEDDSDDDKRGKNEKRKRKSKRK